ncbi:winged helix-turn-helix domain-containing protein [Mycoplana ramosa]|uniref:Winged helix-turn-helix domain-containing protein n=1 Tax=Mycoplana ramosa TaxID=40837 RepID=A0ABW3YWJ2_MYCRA
MDTNSGPDGVWISVAQLAQQKGVSRQSLSERIDRLEREGRLITRRDGRKRLVELATYDRIVGQIGDGAREIGAETKRQGAAPQSINGTLRDAQADRAHYEAKLKALDFAERTGQLVPLRGDHGIETALMKVSELVVRDLGAPLNWVSELLEAAREGEPALRRLLRRKIREQRELIAGRLAALAGEAEQAEKTGIQIDIDFEDEA